MQILTPLSELDNLMGGAIKERVSVALAEVSVNIFDLNTKPDAVRKVTIELIIKPTKSRREATVTAKISSKLAALTDLETVAQIGVDDATGEFVMVEASDIPAGQMDFDGNAHEDKVARFPAAVPNN